MNELRENPLPGGLQGAPRSEAGRHAVPLRGTGTGTANPGQRRRRLQEAAPRGTEQDGGSGTDPRNEHLALYMAMLGLLWFAYFVMRSNIAALEGAMLEFAHVRLFIAAAGFALTLGLGFAVRRFEHRGFWPALAALGVAVIFGTCLFFLLDRGVRLPLFPKMFEILRTRPEIFWMQVWQFLYLHVFVFMAWGCLHLSIRFFVRLQHQRQATLRAVARAHEAKLEVLRYQINPHFLFNTLNAISTLVLQEDNRRAEETIDRLSTFLRHTLASNPKEQVTLAQELEAIDLYLQIQKVRFGRRMAYTFRITKEAATGRVPSLILQPIVENAVKYAVAPQQEGGEVEISARREADVLVIEVCDTGPGVADPARLNVKGTGVGLANCRARLGEFYGSGAGLTLHNRETRGLCVRIVVPYREAPQDE